MRKAVCVVGAGVIGLTTAIVLSRQYDVEIIADRIGVDTDSVKATAIWHVYLVPETAEVLGWASITLRRLLDIERQYPVAGVEVVRGIELFRTQPRIAPTWSHIPPEFSFLTEREVHEFNSFRNDAHGADDEELSRHPVTWGYRLKAPAAKMSSYLSWLVEEAKSANVRFQSRHIDSLAEVTKQFPCVVNCSGLGASDLVRDETFKPYKGQYFVVSADDGAPSEYIGDDDHPGGMAYVIPRAGEVMIGGTAEAGVNDLTETIRWPDVVARAGRYVPWVRDLKNEQPRRLIVGIRPVRPAGIRLERETSHDGACIIHNYGHGGSGFSLSWGCAEQVATLVN